MTDLRCALNDYLTVRRQLGFQLRETGRLLDDYVSYCEVAGEQRLISDLAVRWATIGQRAPEPVAPAAWGGPRVRPLPQHDRP